VETVRAWANRHRAGVAIAAVIAVLTAIGLTVALSTRAQPVEAAPPLPPAISAAATPTPTKLVISVVGKVTNPGLVTLTSGARVADAIRAAGGLIPGTDDTALNLARRLTDGEQIYVGIPLPAADTQQPAATDTPPAPTGKKGEKAAEGTQIDLNTATIDQLQTLPGIGPTMAQRILTWRTQHGHFDSIDQLRDVGGIGDARFAKLAKLVTT
jgi:competence protein ComEA